MDLIGNDTYCGFFRTKKCQTLLAKVASHGVLIAACAKAALNFQGLVVFRKNLLEEIFPVRSKSVLFRRSSYQGSMEGVVATLSRQKRGRNKAVAFSDFFTRTKPKPRDVFPLFDVERRGSCLSMRASELYIG